MSNTSEELPADGAGATARLCMQYLKTAPNITPVIHGLSVSSSVHGKRLLVYIMGDNFSYHGNLGVSVLAFGDNIILPTIFLSSRVVTFYVPQLLPKDTTFLLRIINKKFPVSLFSNSVDFEIT